MKFWNILYIYSMRFGYPFNLDSNNLVNQDFVAIIGKIND